MIGAKGDRARIPALLLATLALLFAAADAFAETPPSLTAAYVAVAAGIDSEARRPVGEADSFPAGHAVVYCYSRITGAVAPLEITHVWYRGGRVMARVPLAVRSGNWRTWSSKTMLPGWTGDWQVKVLDPDGAVLASRDFRIEAPAAADVPATEGEGEEAAAPEADAADVEP